MPSDDGALKECLKIHGELVDKCTAYEKKIVDLKSTLQLQKEDQIGKIKELNNQLKEETKRADQFSKELLDMQESLAEKLGTTIDLSFKEVDRLISVEGDGKKAVDLLRKYEKQTTKDKIDMQGTIDKLEQQIKSDLDQKDYQQLLAALVRKLKREIQKVRRNAQVYSQNARN